MTEPKTDSKVDFWEKLGKASEAELHNIEVEVERIFPEEDAKTGYPIAGYCCTLRAGGLTKDAVHAKVGGGKYRLQARHVDSKRFFAQTSLSLPGPPRIVWPGAKRDGGAPAAPSDSAGRTYQDGFRDAKRELEHETELRELRGSISNLERMLHANNGNGHPSRNAFLEAVEAVGKLKDILGLGAGQGGGIDGFKLIELLREENRRGQDRAQELFDLMAKYTSSSDPDAGLEREMVGIFRDMIKDGRQEKTMDRIAEKVSRSGNPGEAVLTEVREGIAGLLEKKFGAQGTIGAMPVRGARTVPELLVATEDLLDYFAGGEELVDQEEPGEASPGGSVGPGAKDAS